MMKIEFDERKLNEKVVCSESNLNMEFYDYKPFSVDSGGTSAVGGQSGGLDAFLRRTDDKYGKLLKNLAK